MVVMFYVNINSRSGRQPDKHGLNFMLPLVCVATNLSTIKSICPAWITGAPLRVSVKSWIGCVRSIRDVQSNDLNKKSLSPSIPWHRLCRKRGRLSLVSYRHLFRCPLCHRIFPWLKRNPLLPCNCLLHCRPGNRSSPYPVGKAMSDFVKHGPAILAYA